MLHPMLIRMNEIMPQSRKILLYLRNRIKERMIRKGEFLINSGDPGNIFFCIKQGCLKGFTVHGGIKVPNQFMEEGFVLFLPDVPINEHIQAIEDTTIYYIDPSDIDHLSYTSGDFNAFTLVLVQSQCREIGTYSHILQNKTEPERVDWLLERQPALIDRVPTMDLVIYLQIDISTFRKKMPPGQFERN